MARRYRPKYQLPSARRRRPRRRYGILVWVALGLAAWLGWRGYHLGILPTSGTHPASPLAEDSAPARARPGLATPPPPSLTNPNQAALSSRSRPSPITQQQFPRPAADLLEAQIALARQCLCPGSIDGLDGPQTRCAIAAFQRRERLPVTGDLDPATLAQLILSNAPFTSYPVSDEDLARLQPLSPTWIGKSQQDALQFETILEMLAEKAHANPNLIRRLNPTMDWTQVTAGTTARLPDVPEPDPVAKAAFVVVRLTDKVLEAFSAETNLLAHFPCSIARAVEKRPVGLLRVVVMVPNPNYTFDPAIFAESAEARNLNAKLVLPAGPNNPVGVAWIGLDKPGYGIHGTPSPEQVGRTESHGCFRLANWNAAYLLKLAWIGMPVYVEQ